MSPSASQWWPWGVVADPNLYVPGRYNSAFFFKHELLKDFKYYWRMEYVSGIPRSPERRSLMIVRLLAG